jgi:hypothetical protein
MRTISLRRALVQIFARRFGFRQKPRNKIMQCTPSNVWTAAVLSLVVLATNASAQTTWHVDVNGTPPGTGTINDPFTSIQYAVTRPTTVFNDIILVAPGTYVENIRITEGARLRSSAGPEFTRILPAELGTTVWIEAPVGISSLDGFSVATPLGGGPGGGVPAGVFLYDGEISRCIVSDFLGTGGIGVFVDGFGVLSNCTITNTNIGIALNNLFGLLHIRDSIVTGNQTDMGLFGASTAHINYCAGIANIDANLHGQNNLSGDVGFWDPAHNDFNLRPNSQCIDSGDPSSPPDPDGSRADIGALSYNAAYAPAPTNYCAGKQNSDGCVPLIGAIGAASASSAAPFAITAVNEVPQKSGLLFFGFGERAQAFQGGLHCITLPTKRVGVQVSTGAGSCGGTYNFDMQAYIQSGVHPGLVAGALVYCQWWSRDPLDPAGFGTGLSNALRFGIAP